MTKTIRAPRGKLERLKAEAEAIARYDAVVIEFARQSLSILAQVQRALEGQFTLANPQIQLFDDEELGWMGDEGAKEILAERERTDYAPADVTTWIRTERDTCMPYVVAVIPGLVTGGIAAPGDLLVSVSLGGRHAYHAEDVIGAAILDRIDRLVLDAKCEQANAILDDERIEASISF